MMNNRDNDMEVGVGLAGQELIDAAHEPAQAAQTSPPSLDDFVGRLQFLWPERLTDLEAMDQG